MRGSRTIGSGAGGLATAWWLPRAVLILGLAGAVSLVLAEFSTIASVEIPGRTCSEVADLRAVDRCELSGFERHGGALLLLGALAGLMAVGAGRGQSRPAAVAIVAIAIVALGLAILGDLPEAGEVGAIGISYEGAAGKAGTGLYLEIAGGVLLAAAGALSLSTRRKASRRADGTPA